MLDFTQNPVEDEQENRIRGDRDIYQSLSSTLDDHVDQMEQYRDGGKTGIKDEQMIEGHLKELEYFG